MNSPSIKFIHGDMAYHKVGLELLYTLTFTCSGYEGLLTYTGFSLYQIGNLDFSILAFDFSHSTQSGVHVGSSIGSIDFDYLCPFLYTYLHHGKSPRSIYRYALLRQMLMSINRSMTAIQRILTITYLISFLYSTFCVRFQCDFALFTKKLFQSPVIQDSDCPDVRYQTHSDSIRGTASTFEICYPILFTSTFQCRSSLYKV